MKRISILILTATSLLFACQKNMDDTSLSKEQQNFNIYKNAMLSYKASADKGTVGLKSDKQVTKPFEIFGSGTNTYIPGGCGPGTLQVLSGGPDNNATHLGKCTVLLTRCIDLSNGEFIGNIEGVITAANGDEVYFIFTNVGVEPGTGFETQDFNITGGTGRFASCSGSFRNVFPVLTATNFSYHGEGTITY